MHNSFQRTRQQFLITAGDAPGFFMVAITTSEPLFAKRTLKFADDPDRFTRTFSTHICSLS